MVVSVLKAIHQLLLVNTFYVADIADSLLFLSCDLSIRNSQRHQVTSQHELRFRDGSDEPCQKAHGNTSSILNPILLASTFSVWTSNGEHTASAFITLIRWDI